MEQLGNIDNEYGSTAESLDRYFLPFAMAARRDR
jgi:hypothetical protein